MKGGLSSVAGKLHQSISQRQLKDGWCCRHPDQPGDIDQRTNENVGASPTPCRQTTSSTITEPAEEWISKKRYKGSWNQYKCQSFAFIKIACQFQYLAG